MQYDCEGIEYNFPDAEPVFTIKHNECTNLKRVLGNDRLHVLPRSCKVGATSQNTGSGLIRRLTTPAWQTPETAGKVNSIECENLKNTLDKINGGQSFMPKDCNELLLKEERDLAAQYEYENAQVLKRLKKRQTYMAKQDYPPTMC